MAKIRAEVTIFGLVQGVWFRQSTCAIAQEYGVTGWCRNNPDGTVSAVFEGDEAAVNAVTDWCSHGPKMARVDDLQVTTTVPTGEFPDFTIV